MVDASPGAPAPAADAASLDAVEIFEGNPERRCPVVLVLDTSASMTGDPIAQVNEGLRQFEQQIKEDALAALRVELAIVTFGGWVRVIDPRTGQPLDPPDPAAAFATVDHFTAPTLVAEGNTPMGEAVTTALGLLRGRKDLYKAGAIGYYRPWLMLIGDGQPTDSGWEAAAAAAVAEEGRNGVTVFPIAVDKAEVATLGRFSSTRQPMKLRSIDEFGALFSWLSGSLSAVAASQPGEQVALPPVGWAVLDP
jgi:uncharacterized protein YegL